jgi:hypothetical protein
MYCTMFLSEDHGYGRLTTAETTTDSMKAHLAYTLKYTHIYRMFSFSLIHK